MEGAKGHPHGLFCSQGMEGDLDVEGEGERRCKYFDYEEISEGVGKRGSSRNRASGR